MDESARRYARKILLLHLLLLCIVVLLVYFAGREVYQSTRQQVLDQTARRQALLANQTARGIESFYSSILSDLDLLQRSENDENVTTTPAAPTSRPSGRPGRAFVFSKPLWSQLRGRASHLFIFDKNTKLALPLGDRKDSLPLVQIVDRTKPWLEKVNGKAVSGFQLFGDQGVNLVCIPADPSANRVLAAVVPIAQIEETFFNKINADPKLGATLIDDSYRAMATSNRKLIGVNLMEVPDEALKSHVSELLKVGRPFEFALERSVKVGEVEFQPSIVAFEPITLPGKTWWIYIALPTAEVEGVLGQIFRRALIWALFIVISVTAILVSTSIQMIRGRVRAERIRHETLKKELEQARQIQLAWLPNARATGVNVDIAAVNEPASHISGDFYNWFDLPDGRTVVTIGDVTGHGMSAAFLMATTQLLVRTTMSRTNDPGRCMEEINRQLCVQVFNGQFVTMLILVIDPANQHIDIAVGGHPAPMLIEGTSAQILPVTPQLVLGVDCDADYPTERYAFPPHAQLVMYTDGVVDALAPDGRRFTTTGLSNLFTTPQSSAQSLLETVLNAVTQFRGPRELGDDLTLVTIQLQPTVNPAGAYAAN